MITDEMLREAARESLEDYVNSLERDYDPAHPHQFSKEFEKKIERLKRRANHPVFYKTMQRVASVVLAILIGGGAWLTVDVEARAAFFGWVKEVYETFFVYRFSGDADMSTKTSNYEPNWIPDGYSKSRETDTGSRITIFYHNDAGQTLRIHYVYDPDETNIFVDAVGGEIEKVSVGEYSADLILIEDPAVANGLMWTDINNCAFYISAFLDEADLIKVANSIYEKQ